MRLCFFVYCGCIRLWWNWTDDDDEDGDGPTKKFLRSVLFVGINERGRGRVSEKVISVSRDLWSIFGATRMNNTVANDVSLKSK